MMASMSLSGIQGCRVAQQGKASSSRRPASARARFVVQAGAPPSGSKLAVGTKVTVKESITIWHVPKIKGTDLKGHPGVVAEIVDNHKGVPISSTMPVKVEFMITPEGGKPLKFTAHFIDEELEVVQ